MSEFKIGDVVWAPVAGLRPVMVTCPVCAGNRVVRLELGSGEMVELPCENCAKGYNAPRGEVEECTTDPGAVARIIDGIERNETAGGVEIVYRSCGFGFREAFGTRDEAMARACDLAEQAAHAERQLAERIKHDQNKNYAWNAGYHMREARAAREKAAYHESMAKLCRERQAARGCAAKEG